MMVGAGVLAISLQLISPAPVLAHASLVRAEPAPNSVLDQPPSQVVCWFAEAVEPGYSEIKVVDSHGTQVDNRDSPRRSTRSHFHDGYLPTLPMGIYSVVYSTVSAADGHSLRDSYIFAVGVPLAGAAPVQPAQTPPLQPFGRVFFEMAGFT